MCSLCNKKIGTSVFAVGKTLVHFVCFKDSQGMKAVSKTSHGRRHDEIISLQGCDGSLLLDSIGGIVSEKNSVFNSQSVRGFEVIDQIKAQLEKECPGTVSCADVLTLAARDSSVLSGGPSWVVPLGRRDSINASLSGSNSNIPASNDSFKAILRKFNRHGLDVTDLVALSGSHTIGFSRCTSFRQRLYNQSGDGRPDITLEESFAANLRKSCPIAGGEENLSVLDMVTAAKFDNNYFINLIKNMGLLYSDQILFSGNDISRGLVITYAQDQEVFFSPVCRVYDQDGEYLSVDGFEWRDQEELPEDKLLNG